jgi:hypothetical protein
VLTKSVFLVGMVWVERDSKKKQRVSLVNKNNIYYYYYDNEIKSLTQPKWQYCWYVDWWAVFCDNDTNECITVYDTHDTTECAQRKSDSVQDSK